MKYVPYKEIQKEFRELLPLHWRFYKSVRDVFFAYDGLSAFVDLAYHYDKRFIEGKLRNGSRPKSPNRSALEATMRDIVRRTFYYNKPFELVNGNDIESRDSNRGLWSPGFKRSVIYEILSFFSRDYPVFIKVALPDDYTGRNLYGLNLPFVLGKIVDLWKMDLRAKHNGMEEPITYVPKICLRLAQLTLDYINHTIRHVYDLLKSPPEEYVNEKGELKDFGALVLKEKGKIDHSYVKLYEERFLQDMEDFYQRIDIEVFNARKGAPKEIELSENQIPPEDRRDTLLEWIEASDALRICLEYDLKMNSNLIKKNLYSAESMIKEYKEVIKDELNTTRKITHEELSDYLQDRAEKIRNAYDPEMAKVCLAGDSKPEDRVPTHFGYFEATDPEDILAYPYKSRRRQEEEVLVLPELSQEEIGEDWIKPDCNEPSKLAGRSKSLNHIINSDSAPHSADSSQNN